MTRRTFIKKMRQLGFELKQEGLSWYLTKDFDDKSNNYFVLFIKKKSYTSSDDNYKKMHIEEWCEFRAWDKSGSVGQVLIGGEMDFLPFSMVKEYLIFFNNLYQELKYEKN